MAQQYQLRYLGALPLDMRIREETDSGTPTVVADPECAVSRTYREIARHAAAAIAAVGTPVFAVKGETLEEYWEYTHRIFEWHDGGAPTMILDDGGDATLLVTLGATVAGTRAPAPHLRGAR